jgi:hypothetical protein
VWYNYANDIRKVEWFMQQYVLSIDDGTDVTMKNGILAMLKSMPFIKITQTSETVKTPTQPRKLGGLEGKVWMSDDFNAPLEEFEEYM